MFYQNFFWVFIGFLLGFISAAVLAFYIAVYSVETGRIALRERNGDWFVEGTDEWGSWMYGHYKSPYIDWLPVDRKIYAWLEDNYRFTPREDSAGEPKVV